MDRPPIDYDYALHKEVTARLTVLSQQLTRVRNVLIILTCITGAMLGWVIGGLFI